MEAKLEEPAPVESGFDKHLPPGLREIGAHYILVHPISKFALRLVMEGKIKPAQERQARRQARALFTHQIDLVEKARPRGWKTKKVRTPRRLRKYAA